VSKYEMIGMVLGIVIFGTILVAAIWAGSSDPRPGRRS
jgi:hypothetical protein